MTEKRSPLAVVIQAQRLFTALFAQALGFIEHRFKLEGGAMQSRFYPTMATCLKSMPYWNARAHHYFGVATRRDSTSGRKRNLFHLVCFHGDVDYGQERYYKNREEALAAIEAFPMRPSAVVHTGNGFHVYWFLLAPLPAGENLFQVEAINKGIGQALKGDPVGDASRILRVPGTCNVKDPANPKSVTTLWCENLRYSLDEFASYAVSPPREDTPRPTSGPVSYGDIGGTPYGRAALGGELARLAQSREGSHCRNIRLNKAAYALGRLVVAGHLGEDTVVNLLVAVGANIGLGERETWATVRSGLRAGLTKG